MHQQNSIALIKMPFYLSLKVTMKTLMFIQCLITTCEIILGLESMTVQLRVLLFIQVLLSPLTIVVVGVMANLMMTAHVSIIISVSEISSEDSSHVHQLFFFINMLYKVVVCKPYQYKVYEGVFTF